MGDGKAHAFQESMIATPQQITGLRPKRRMSPRAQRHRRRALRWAVAGRTLDSRSRTPYWP